jgi:RNA polymerase sigma-70 factor (sigma-E family)
MRRELLAADTAREPGGRSDLRDQADVDAVLTMLYRVHALRLTRLAYVMLGNKPAAEDVVQDAFAGLYRRWGRLSDQRKALEYLRSSVLNGCRTAIRRNRPHRTLADLEPSAISAETAVLASERQRTVMRAIRRLPDRQREALVLRFYLDEPEAEIARLMGIRPGTVRSTTHRALAALGRLLEEES